MTKYLHMNRYGDLVPPYETVVTEESNSSSMACSIADSELVERAVRNARNNNPCPTMPRWHAVSRVFACGSTEAQKLCRRYGLDPDDELPTTVHGQ
jgi:hypothetical protein